MLPFVSVILDSVAVRLIDEMPASSSDKIVPSPFSTFICEMFSS